MNFMFSNHIATSLTLSICYTHHRKFSSQQVAERANISRPTLSAIEKGNPTVSIGSYLLVLQVLGLEKDFLSIAKDDELGRKLQDASISTSERAPKRINKNG